jgi:translocator protein
VNPRSRDVGASFSTRPAACYLNPVPLLPLAALFGLITFVCALFLLVHAFRRSLGTGMMVLLVPFYLLVYAFSQFEHPRKSLILAGFFGSTLLAAVFLGLGAHALEQVLAHPAPAPF